MVCCRMAHRRRGNPVPIQSYIRLVAPASWRGGRLRLTAADQKGVLVRIRVLWAQVGQFLTRILSCVPSAIHREEELTSFRSASSPSAHTLSVPPAEISSFVSAVSQASPLSTIPHSL